VCEEPRAFGRIRIQVTGRKSSFKISLRTWYKDAKQRQGLKFFTFSINFYFCPADYSKMPELCFAKFKYCNFVGKGEIIAG
jgi:hypothetical protein